MKIYTINKQNDLRICSKSVKRAIACLLNYLDIRCDEVSFHFVTTKKISQLHADFFNDPTTTDCITFPIDEEGLSDYRILGEVFICPQTAIDYSKKKQINPYKETTLYLVHGLLHLIGYDDIDPKDRKKMRSMERSCMAELEKNGLILSTRQDTKL